MIEQQIAELAAQAFAGGEALVGRFGATVALLSIGIALYGAVVGTFYNHLSKRVLYESNKTSREINSFLGKFGHWTVLLFKYTILFPAITFIWFVLLASFLFLLSSTATLENVFVISISVVAAVRILAYYKEEIAVDLAKMLPLALFGVVIVEPTLFNSELVQERVLQLSGALPEFAALIAFVIALEWTLKIISSVVEFVKEKLAVGEPEPARQAHKKGKLEIDEEMLNKKR
ncbi:MAG: hypothetical protein WC506_05605 [Candidatus Micrarchaeia archaeon]